MVFAKQPIHVFIFGADWLNPEEKRPVRLWMLVSAVVRRFPLCVLIYLKVYLVIELLKQAVINVSEE